MNEVSNGIAWNNDINILVTQYNHENQKVPDFWTKRGFNSKFISGMKLYQALELTIFSNVSQNYTTPLEKEIR